MKNFLLLIVFSLTLTLGFFIWAYIGREKPLESKLTGRWEMQEVYEKDEEVTNLYNPGRNRYIELYPTGAFESGGDPHGKNTGIWLVNNLNQFLYIDSNQGPGDDSLWKVSIEDDRMEWKGTVESNQTFRLTFTKASDTQQ